MKVCIDAGHYGRHNQSPNCPAYFESEMTWNLAERLAFWLDKWKIEYAATRSDQAADLPVYDRGRLSKGCDLFLSLHSNAATNKDGSPYEGDHVSAFYTAGDALREVDISAAKKAAKNLATAACVTMNQAAAKCRKKLRSDGLDYYGVLRGAAAVGTPGVILECGFHTNADTALWLMDSGNIDNLARQIAHTLADLGGIIVMPGDLDGDGDVTANDLIYMRAIIQGFRKASPRDLIAGDLDGDGRITIKDFTILSRKINLFTN